MDALKVDRDAILSHCLCWWKGVCDGTDGNLLNGRDKWDLPVDSWRVDFVFESSLWDCIEVLNNQNGKLGGQ